MARRSESTSSPFQFQIVVACHRFTTAHLSLRALYSGAQLDTQSEETGFPPHPQALDDRGRGYGGFNASCGEENLLRLPCDRYRDHRDILTHEFAHTCLSWGLGAAFEAR